MRPRLLGALLIFFPPLLALGIIAAACGGDGDRELTLEHYFQQFDAVDDDITARLDALGGEFPGAFQEPGTTLDFFNKTVEIFGDGIDRLDDMDPPEEAQRAHDEFRGAVRALQEQWQEFSSQLAEVQDASGLQEVLQLGAPDLEAVAMRLEDACLALQGIADASGIDVELDCTT